jgi:uncharacterized protein YqfA (UPF0365 family)
LSGEKGYKYMTDVNAEAVDLKQDIIKTYKYEYMARPENDPKGSKGLVRKLARRWAPAIDWINDALTGDSFIKKAVSVTAVATGAMCAMAGIMSGVGGLMLIGASIGAVAGPTAAGIGAVIMGVGSIVTLAAVAGSHTKPLEYKGSVAQKMLEADIENGTLVNSYLRDVMTPEMVEFTQKNQQKIDSFTSSNQQKLAQARSLSNDFEAVRTANTLERACEQMNKVKVNLDRKP